MPLTLRSTKGSALTYTELDGNFTFLSSSISANAANGANDEVLTSNGTGGIVGEPNLTFDGTTLTVYGNLANGAGNQAIGAGSHAEGFATTALGDYQHVQGLFNMSSTTPGAFILGNGSGGSPRNLIYAHDSIVEITGSVTISDVLTLPRRETTPAAGTFSVGSIILSGSSTPGSIFLYVYTGAGAAAGWAKITAV